MINKRINHRSGDSHNRRGNHQKKQSKKQMKDKSNPQAPEDVSIDAPKTPMLTSKKPL
jgi:hypothetical protein